MPEGLESGYRKGKGQAVGQGQEMPGSGSGLVSDELIDRQLSRLCQRKEAKRIQIPRIVRSAIVDP